VGPSSHNTNPLAVFAGQPCEWATEDSARDAETIEAVRRFVEKHGLMPGQNSRTAARMSPLSEPFGNDSEASGPRLKPPG